ncbi:MAG: Crp/Fnr family transcriptional regulator, partial [Clostridia bacterium]|nr:Crp/Fnr family transcriptional regulator [Clostridia bacterium]
SAPVAFSKGDEIYRVGNVGIIVSGKAKIVRRSESGTVMTVRNLKDGEIFGAASVFGEWSTSLSSITATCDVTVRYITEEGLKELFSAFPTVSVNYVRYLTDRIRFLNRKLDAFSAGNTEERLYEYLLSVSDADGRVSLDFGMAELARRLRVGRSSLYRSIDALVSSVLLTREKNEFIIKK